MRSIESNSQLIRPLLSITVICTLLFFVPSLHVQAQISHIKEFNNESNFIIENWTSNYVKKQNTTFFSIADYNTFTYELWKSDGTAEGTSRVKEGVGLQVSDTANGLLYFASYDFNYLAGGQLWMWRSDGTDAGTYPLENEVPVNPTNFLWFKHLNGKIFFATQTPSNTYELWKTDGTAAGTALIKSFPGGFTWFYTVYNGNIYFASNDGTNGFELWKTDGTESGTTMIKNLNPTGSSDPVIFAVFKNKIYFYATDDGIDYKVWVTDGTEAGTQLLKNVGWNFFSNNYENSYEIIGETLYFVGKNEDNGSELWKTDGTPNGTVLVKDIFTGVGSSNPVDICSVNGILYFKATTDGTNYKLWRSDGTELGTSQVSSLSDIRLFPQSDALYFVGSNGTQSHLWRTTNGYDCSTVKIDDQELYVGLPSSEGKILLATMPNLYIFDSQTDTVLGKCPQSITFSNMNRFYGDSAYIPATTNSGLATALASSDTNVAVINNNKVSIKKVGLSNITVTQVGNKTYAPAQASQTLSVNPKAITVSANVGQSKLIGTADPILTFTSAPALVSNDTFTGSLSRSAGEAAGSYNILLGTLTAGSNYRIAFNGTIFCVNPAKPVITPSSNSSALTSSSNTGNQWFKDNNPIDGAISDTYLATENGSYSVKVTIDNCSSLPSDAYPLIVTSVQKIGNVQVNVYPNPTVETLQIDITALSGNSQISVYDVLGKPISFVEGHGLISIDLKDEKSGVYHVQIQNESFLATYQVIKK